ncbi:MAG: sugar ABC transporter permease [Lachnospiraceae bacterium]|nr:sugar ABC transporter permease [Lachnospiraceae bacterium]
MDKLLRKKSNIILFLAPAFILFTAVLIVPIGTAFYYSLCDYKISETPKFVFLKNYITMFTSDADMKTAFKNSIFFMIFSCVTQLIFGLVLAALLTNIKRGRDFFKNVYYLPCVLSSAALGLLWYFIFHPKYGINKIMENLGLLNKASEGKQWLADTSGFIILPIVVISFVALWQYVGQSMMLYMAQISGISKDIYEAAAIDGCSKTQSFFRITLPLIKPMVATAMSLNAIGSLKFFDLIFSMLPESMRGVGGKAHVLATVIYDQGLRYSKYGYACSVGMVLLAMCLLVTFLINKFVKTESYDM